MQIIPNPFGFGAVVRGTPSPEDYPELKAALYKYGLLQGEGGLTFDQMREITLLFGDQLEEHRLATTLKDEGYPEVTVVHRKPELRNIRSVVNMWHHDVTAKKHPPIISLLQADIVPDQAGTIWSDTRKAYELLPEQLKTLFKSIEIEHDSLEINSRHGVSPGNLTKEYLSSVHEIHHHPAVVKHYKTGEPCLFVANGFVKKVAGYRDEISKHIMAIANEYPVLPELQIRHNWKKGDWVLYDNFMTCHYGIVGNLTTEERRLYRVSAYSESVTPVGFGAPVTDEVAQGTPNKGTTV